MTEKQTPTDWIKSAGAYDTPKSIDWFQVAQFAARSGSSAGTVLPGTAPWCALADDDPRKAASCVAVAAFWALNETLRWDAMKQAAVAISESADWTQVARRLIDRTNYQSRNPWSKRLTA